MSVKLQLFLPFPLRGGEVVVDKEDDDGALSLWDSALKTFKEIIIYLRILFFGKDFKINYGLLLVRKIL